MKTVFFTLSLFLVSLNLIAQEPVFQTFKDRWVINSVSVEMLPKHKLDIRITHRFGDMFGAGGNWKTFYGLDNSTDILIGGEYGVTNNLSAGLFRTKGAGDLKQLVSTTLKYRIIQQAVGGSPVSLVVAGVSSISTQKKNLDSEGINRFDKFAHRLVYHMDAIVGRKFSDFFSLQLSGGYTHRNIVPNDDENDLADVGVATRIQISKSLGLIADFTLPLNGKQSPFTSEDDPFVDYYPILGFGLEFETGGHVFQLNFTNAKAIMPTDYIPFNTNANWFDGEFRIGFTISRIFNL